MPFSQFIPTFMLMLAAVLSSWLVIKSLEMPVNRPEPPQNPDTYMFNVSATKMNALTGKPQDQLFSPQIVHYAAGDIANVTTPHIVIFSDNGNQPWNITANNGQAQNGIDTVLLWNNVRMVQAAGPTNAAMTITTSSITIFPHQQYAQTQQAVTLVQPSGTASAIGLHAYLETGVMDLLTQARGQYQNVTATKK